MTAEQLLKKFGITLPSYAPGEHHVVCPRCSHKRQPKNRKLPVLGVLIDERGATWSCAHCNFSGPPKGAARGEPKPQLVAYEYYDRDSVLRFRKIRNTPGGKGPKFWLQKPEGNKWVSNVKGVDTSLLYHANEIEQAIADGREIIVCEGEKDCDNLRKLGFTATSSAHGASMVGKTVKWLSEHSEQLRGADIIIIPDNDGPGRQHAEAAARLSVPLARRIRFLDLALHWKEIPENGDVSDWLEAGHSADELRTLIAGCADFAPSEQSPPPSEPASPPASEKTALSEEEISKEIERLAGLSELQFEQERRAAVEKLGLRAAYVDRLVKAARAPSEDDGLQGSALAFPEAEPWPTAVIGTELLNELAAAIGSYVVMPEASRVACALWCLHTHMVTRFMITPRLGLVSPIRGCGKTTALDIIGRLVSKPLPAANTTASALFRTIEKFMPTVLIDEADRYLAEREELIGIINAGHRRGGAVLRTVGDSFEVRSFKTFSPLLVAMIGRLPDTIQDRSIVISLKRKSPSEYTKSYRADRADDLDVLLRKCVRWCADNGERVSEIDPPMPDALTNRSADNWRALLQIADAVGAEWPVRARKAALEGREAAGEDDNKMMMAVHDICTAFHELKVDRLSSAALIERLCADPNRPWNEYGKSQKPLSQAKLARLLRPLSIPAQGIRIADKTPRGYYRHQFREAAERYLPPEWAFKVQQWHKVDEISTSDTFQSATDQSVLHFENGDLSNNDGPCCTVALSKGENGKNAREAPSEASPEAPSDASLSPRTIRSIAADIEAWADTTRRPGTEISDADIRAEIEHQLTSHGVPLAAIGGETERVLAALFEGH